MRYTNRDQLVELLVCANAWQIRLCTIGLGNFLKQTLELSSIRSISRGRLTFQQVHTPHVGNCPRSSVSLTADVSLRPVISALTTVEIAAVNNNEESRILTVPTGEGRSHTELVLGYIVHILFIDECSDRKSFRNVLDPH